MQRDVSCSRYHLPARGMQRLSPTQKSPQTFYFQVSCLCDSLRLWLAGSFSVYQPGVRNQFQKAQKANKKKTLDVALTWLRLSTATDRRFGHIWETNFAYQHKHSSNSKRWENVDDVQLFLEFRSDRDVFDGFGTSSPHVDSGNRQSCCHIRRHIS